MDTVSSSRRFKEDIQDMADASSGLMRLRPVTFRYQKPFADGSKPIQYGLIAEEVAEVYPDLVAHSADRQIETVNYQVLDSMLLNEVQISPSVKGQYRLQFLVAIQTDLGPPIEHPSEHDRGDSKDSTKMSGPFADASTGQSYGIMQRANSTWRTPLRAQYHKPATGSKPENSGPFALEPSSVAQVHAFIYPGGLG